jgi:hypothetical protein
MNPFTRFLLGRKSTKVSALEALVEHWDALEALVIRVYKGKEADTADLAEYEQLKGWLVENYTVWENELRPFWQATRAGGRLTEQDPFLRLLAAEQAGDFVGDWEAMQHLPAAREALNRFIQAAEG